MDINATTSVICILIAVFALAMYVLADGFDLGIGILLLITKDLDERDELVETIAPIWDGNETWLILAAITLFGAFPTAYSVLVPAFYLPFLVMLVALGFRGVSIEFRSETRFKHFWDYAFSIGSIVAAFCQGLVAGALLSGDVVVDHERFAGNTLDVFTWFNMLVGLTTVTAYAALGAGWTYWRTEGQLQHLQKLLLRQALIAFLVLTVLTCTFSLGAFRIEQLWSSQPTMLIVVAVLSFVLWALALRSVDGKSDCRPLFFSMGPCLYCYLDS
ncbi:cytochrome d ubiquinol oxidase subunit II [Pseudomonas sp. PCH199]|nr:MULTISPECIES: cytochrome d ubiquinol oxidase subunit II [unclassified Pseudomonas]MCW8279108.1 cytochrome d ubiquinol oxidase subunit II [Pseudomonas sp. PCH199]PAM79621.1 cytochrome d ubiquinol oxidase subunit II [Pseudomonas sp. ERMR1:02]